MAMPAYAAGMSRSRRRTGHRSLMAPVGTPGRPSNIPTIGGHAGPESSGGKLPYQLPGAPPPPPGPLPPPKLPENEATRISADTQYGTTTGDLNHQLYQAALHYGDPNLVNQYKGYANAGDLSSDPNSVLATNAREATQSNLDLGNALERNNTFFSGIHEKGLGDIADLLTRKNSQGYQDFQDALSKITTGLAQAKADRDKAFGGANAADITAALNNPPQPSAPPPPPQVPQNANVGGSGMVGAGFVNQLLSLGYYYDPVRGWVKP